MNSRPPSRCRRCRQEREQPSPPSIAGPPPNTDCDVLGSRGRHFPAVVGRRRSRAGPHGVLHWRPDETDLVTDDGGPHGPPVPRSSKVFETIGIHRQPGPNGAARRSTGVYHTALCRPQADYSTSLTAKGNSPVGSKRTHPYGQGAGGDVLGRNRHRSPDRFFQNIAHNQHAL